MTVLSVVAVARLAERCVRQVGQPVPVEQLVAQLGNFGVHPDRAHAGVRLAEVVGRLEATTDGEGEPCVRVPAPRKKVAA